MTFQLLHSELRKILFSCLSVFNTFFLQGFNRIAAIALLFMNEEDAFWCLVYIVEQLMPPQYYSKQLVGAQVDQVITEAVFPVAHKLALYRTNYLCSQHGFWRIFRWNNCEILSIVFRFRICFLRSRIPIQAFES
jgi:hypothetical protein